jgi:hypothetical protein
MRWIVFFSLVVILIPAINVVSADREGSAEAFLCRDDGQWTSTRRADGNVILFLFGKDDIYCGGETMDALTKTCGKYEVWSGGERYYLKLSETTGKVIKMPLEIKNDYTIILNGVELKRRYTDQGKQTERQYKDKKADERIKSEIEYEDKSIAIRKRLRMKEQLDALGERCQKKRNELNRQWDRNFPGSVGRSDIIRDLETLRRDCEKEAKQIRDIYEY